jgi:two-component system, NarL family, response regulator LiaR
MTESIRILIAEDHPVVRMGLRALIASEPGLTLAGEAVDGDDAILKALELAPDVILMDLLMPSKDGLEASIAIRQANPEAHILILTSYADSDRVVASMRSGALGYILKDAHPQEIIDAIRQVHAGRVYIHPAMARQLFQGSGQPSTGQDRGPFEVLTERETEVLKLLASGLSNEDIAARLVISKYTAGVHVGRILQKLNLTNRTQAALYALRARLVDLNAP